MPDVDGDAPDEGNPIPQWVSALATCLVIGASFVNTIGLNCQKLAHNKAALVARETALRRGGRGGSASPPDTPRSIATVAKLPGPRGVRQRTRQHWLWVLGIGCMIIGGLMDLAALPFLPLTRVAALGSCTMVTNVIVTPLFLREKVTCHDLAGSALSILGTSAACYFGAAHDTALSRAQLMNRFVTPPMICYMVTILLVLLVLRWLIAGYSRVAAKAREMELIGPRAPLEVHIVYENLERLHQLRLSPFFPFVTSLGPQFYPGVHAVYGGIVGAHAVTFAKIEMLFVSDFVGPDFTFADKWSGLAALITLGPLAICLYKQLRYLNKALQIYKDALFVAPNYQSAWIVTGVVLGMILYRENRAMSDWDMLWFLVGVFVTLVGLVVLSLRDTSSLQDSFAVEGPMSRRHSYASLAPFTPVHAPLQGVLAVDDEQDTDDDDDPERQVLLPPAPAVSPLSAAPAGSFGGTGGGTLHTLPLPAKMATSP
eukprot:TRINITY_DN60231_c0_g1_i1.p1 TRINITY_DN60231_c0_g1~~TRINITY_DN60231_c0_g1_i1.p1  ORF type:complete len:485 (+),score=54.83 TRINITY_DN60231_c0_g1_i1:74-1528(+)